MKGVSNSINDLEVIFENNLENIKQKVEVQKILISKLIDENKSADPDFVEKMIKLCPSRLREYKLKKLIEKTIFTLEDTRKNFKSKKLETLRKDLISSLVEL